MATVFIIDDDEIVRRSLARMLRAGGLQVVPFGVADEALQRLVEKPDLLICDYHMPRVTGLAIAVEAKKRTPEIKIILLSGGVSDDPVVAALKAKIIDRFLTKPWHVDDLLLVVKELLAPPKP